MFLCICRSTLLDSVFTLSYKILWFLSGAFLEDAMFVSCGHSFGGLMLRRVIDTVSETNLHAFFFFFLVYIFLDDKSSKFYYPKRENLEECSYASNALVSILCAEATAFGVHEFCHVICSDKWLSLPCLWI